MILSSPERIQDYTSRGWWEGRTLDDLFAAQTAAGADRLALLDPPNRGAICGGAPRRLTYGALGGLVDRLASVLLEQGVGKDDIVAVQLPNIAELVALYLAATRIGAILAPFPVQYRSFELTQLGRFIEPRIFITAARIGDQPRAAQVVELRAAIPSLRAVLALGEAVPDGAQSLDAALARPADGDRLAAHRARHPVGANDIATLCFTSGTTGVPKGVPRSHNEWVAIAHASVEGARMRPGIRLLNPFPLVNMAGIGGMIVPWLISGGILINHHPLDLAVFLGQIAAERPEYTVAPPTLLTMLLKNEALLAKADLSSLRIIGSGSAPLPPSMVKAYQERFGIAVTNVFGSNEGVCLLSGADDFPDPEQRAQYFPRFGVPRFEWRLRAGQMQRTRLVALESGIEIEEPGLPGELRIKGPMVFAGYWRNPEADAAAFDNDGFFRTGDMFEIAGDAAGAPRYYRFVGRCKDLIIRGGMNIAPEEVEALLAGHPGIAEVAVVGYPDEIMGERTRAVIVPRGQPAPTLPALVAFLEELGIAKYKLPERLDCVPALPRNPVGKVLKDELRRTFRP